MDVNELKKRLEGLPRYKFIILAGGSMVMHKLREETQDVDICVTEDLAKELGLSDKEPNEKGYYELPGGMDVMVGLNKVNCEVVDDYLCQRLEDILKFKSKRNLPKDQPDIEAIISYFSELGHS